MPQHTKEHMDTFVRVFEKSLEMANKIYERDMQKYMDNLEKEENDGKPKL
jgi:hypothetical protein